MAIHFDALFGSLVHPTDTFNRLKEEANLGDGLKLYMIVLTVSTLIGVITTKLVSMKVMASLGAYLSSPQFRRSLWAYSDIGIISSAVLGIVISVVIFLALSWLVAKLAKAISNGTGDFGKTACLLAYVSAAATLFIGIPISIIQTAYTLATPMSLTATGLVGGAGILGLLLAFFIIGILFLIWMLILNGKAVAAANNISLGGGIASLIIGGLIVLAVVFVIGFIAAFGMLAHSGLSYGLMG